VRNERVRKKKDRRAALFGGECELSHQDFGFDPVPASRPPGDQGSRRKIDDDDFASTRLGHLQGDTPRDLGGRTHDQEAVQIDTSLGDRGGIKCRLRVHPCAPRSLFSLLGCTNDRQRHARGAPERVRRRELDDAPWEAMIRKDGVELGPSRWARRAFER
jgi:hypothetical protein